MKIRELEHRMKSLGATVVRVGVVGIVVAVAISIMPESSRVARASEPMAATSPQPPSQFQVPFELFKTWNIDKEKTEQMPAGFSSFGVGSAEAPIWIVTPDPSAQTPPNILKPSASCKTEDCSQVLL